MKTAPYNLLIKPSAEKDLRNLPKEIVMRVLARIEVLPEHPFPRQTIKLSGAERFYRLRISDYRVVYEVLEEAKQVVIHHVRHRKEVYRRLR